MADRFFVGQGIRVSLEFHNTSGTLTDPVVPSVSVLKPDATNPIYVYPTNPELVKDSTGKYHVDIDIDQDGDWFVKGTGTGTITVSSEVTFRGVATHAI